MIDRLTALYAAYPAAVCGLVLLIGVPVALFVYVWDKMGKYQER